MMATELVPSFIPDSDKNHVQDTSNTIPPLPECKILFCCLYFVDNVTSQNVWEEDHGFSLPGQPSCLNSQPTYASPISLLQNGVHSSRHDSIDLFHLPENAFYSQQSQMGQPGQQGQPVEPGQPLQSSQDPFSLPVQSSPVQPSFFNSSSIQDDMMQALPLPSFDIAPNGNLKRNYKTDLDYSPVDEDPELAKKRRRMEKNRQTAKTCRQRKKERKEAIQEEVGVRKNNYNNRL